MKYYLWTISVLAAPFTEFAPEPSKVCRAHNCALNKLPRSVPDTKSNAHPKLP